VKDISGLKCDFANREKQAQTRTNRAKEVKTGSKKAQKSPANFNAPGFH
jgi:hypothetical protein